MRRGQTLIEMLLALGLLTAVTVAVAAWLDVTARTVAITSAPARWENAAHVALELIARDLAVGDDAPENSGRRVEATNVELVIQTRLHGLGPATVRYRHDASSERLFRVSERSSELSDERVLIGRVSTWTARIDEEQETLLVTIVSDQGQSLQRSYVLR